MLPSAIRSVLLCAATATVLPVGVTARQASNPAHAHVGHVADAWRPAPDGMGLLPTAMAEAEIAKTHADLAASSAGDLAAIQTHLGHVMHAISPAAMETGPGRGFGLLEASQGVVRHIELAAAAEGASDNVKLHGEHVAASARGAAERAEAVLALARTALETTDADRAAELAGEIQTALERIVSGHDADGDGRVGWQQAEGGLEQAATHVTLLKRGEGMEGGAR